MPAALLLVSFLDCASPRQKCECREKLARDELIRVRAGVVDRARVSAVVLGPYASHYPRFRNDRAVSEIRIGARQFKCVGLSPPHDHPHIYIDMGERDAIRCSYCATRFRFDPRLGPFEADPPDSQYII